MESHYHERMAGVIICIVSAIISFIFFGFIISAILGTYAWGTAILLMIKWIAITLIASAIYLHLFLQKNQGFYRCKKCGCLFKPNIFVFLLSPYGFKKRLIICPRCKKYRICDKIWDNCVKENDFEDDDDDED